ncbi:hypothetical protein O2W18_00470 [Modestobacter sp. VKM Ac-2983]|uniref:hypothetical protein n=1 Tax=Modestobacter sp. VKM Ac-2983 TaxID=3004137 RepID=UPI0022AB7C73|nr:hypothetical protein [Modestobacter sp. VKM Ac-2983]MCZ2803574.1 hypothetical protein [Modestobacter sp. VKM Ac-2983]
MSWFQRGNLISQPSMSVLGRPGLGESTIVRRMALGLAGYGVQPMVLGDLRPDYVDLIEALGGQVLRLVARTSVVRLTHGSGGGPIVEWRHHAILVGHRGSCRCPTT